MTVVTVEHVSKAFQQLVHDKPQTVSAVNDVSLKIGSGDVMVILGPSGCGKSTLLRIIAGLHEPDSGEVLYDNVPLKEVPMRERGIGMVFQEGALMPHWEAVRSVGFFLKLRKREHEVPERVHRIAQITGFGIEQLMDRRPSQLSGGEQQRVSVARCLTRDPRLFLFDEPFSNLDAKLRSTARIELKRLLKEFPVTSVYVTHDQHEAVSLGHRIAVMREGHIEQVGTYQQLYANPVNQFVATFVGTPGINLFEGFAVETRFQGENFTGYRLRSDLEEGTRVTLGLRPEHFRLDPDGVPCVVEDITPYYAERHQLLSVRSGRERWHFYVPLDMDVHAGEKLGCSVDTSGLLYFDTKTGKRIG